VFFTLRTSAGALRRFGACRWPVYAARVAEKRLRLRRPDTCRVCAVELGVGSEGFYDRATRSVRCVPCGSDAAPPGPPEEIDSGQAGASAQAEFDRRRRARIERGRERFGVLGAAVAWWKEPQHERAWAAGAAGERRVGERLTKRLADTGVLLLHDRSVPKSRANIDHLAVGPGGVTVIDAKNLSGKVRAASAGGIIRPRTEHLMVSGRDRTKLIEGLERQMDVVRSLLEGTQWQEIDVQGCLCLATEAGLPLLGTVRVRGVPVLASGGSAKLAAREGELAPDAVQRLHRRLALALPPAVR
jgi:hypothetical protein